MSEHVGPWEIAVREERIGRPTHYATLLSRFPNLAEVRLPITGYTIREKGWEPYELLGKIMFWNYEDASKVLYTVFNE